MEILTEEDFEFLLFRRSPSAAKACLGASVERRRLPPGLVTSAI